MSNNYQEEIFNTCIMPGNNYLIDIFENIANEFSGKEFTTEDLFNKFGESIYNSKIEIDERIWSRGNKFSIIHVEEYPELNSEELSMLQEIMNLYDYIPCGCSSTSQFIQDLKLNRKNIAQWYASLLPTPEQHNINALKYANDLKYLRCGRQSHFAHLYSVEEYCQQIMNKDSETYKKYKEDELSYLYPNHPITLEGNRPINRPINPWKSLMHFSLKPSSEIINHYGLNVPSD